MANIRLWSTTAASNNFSTGLGGWPENMLAASVNNAARQNLADVRGTFQQYPYFDWGHTPTRTGATTFTVPTDLTTVYKVGLRIQCTDATELYGVITSSVYGAVTTVTVVLDSGSLTASLSAVAVQMAPQLDALPVVTTAGGTTTYTAVLPGVTAYHTKLAFIVIMNDTNTGSSTLNINGLGAKTIKFGTQTMSSGSLVIGRAYPMAYDGTDLQVSGLAFAEAGGATTNVQYNLSDALFGDSGFTYNGLGTATLTTGLTVGGNSTAAGKINFKEDTDNGTNTCILSGPQSTGDVTITLPASTGTVVLEDNAVALSAKTSYNGAVITPATTTVGAKIALKEGTNNGTNTVTIAAPDSTADVVATLQAVTGTIALTSDIPTIATGTVFNTQIGSLTTSSTVAVTANTWTDSGLTVNITPTSSSNKVMIQGSITLSHAGTNGGFSIRIVRGSTAIGVATDPQASQLAATSGAYLTSQGVDAFSLPFFFVDSPATSSATTYKIQISSSASQNMFVNRTATDTNSASFRRYASNIIVQEVKV